MPIKPTQTHKSAILLFIALSGCYLSLSPGSIAGQGYGQEEIDSGLRILSIATAWMKGHPLPPMIWSRHGPVSLIFDLPFLKLGKSIISPDFMLSFEPALVTAALVTLLFLWLRKFCSPGVSLFLSLAAAFTTMLWPYAYIGLETKQSFFVFLAGYLALAGKEIRSWPRLLLFATVCGLALSTKSTGITLWPVVAYLVYEQFKNDWRARRVEILTVCLGIGAIWVLGHWGANHFWGPRGGGATNFRSWLIDSPLQFFINAIGVLGSPSKGFFVYSPLLLASLYAIPRAFRTRRPLTIFTLLVAGCALGFICLLTSPADEVWGARYMHVAIAPLVLIIGAAFPTFEWRRYAAIGLLCLVGLAISFLGALYYYGQIDFAASKADENVMQWLTGDSSWNPIEFDARLFRTWLSGNSGSPMTWTPQHTWVWVAPPDATPWRSIDLREFCQPQSFMLRFWRVPKNGVVLRLFSTYVLFLMVGILGLIWVVLMTIQDQQVRTIGDLELSRTRRASLRA